MSDQDAKRHRVIEHVVTCTVNTNASPVLTLNKNNRSYHFVIDTGCTGNIMDKDTAIQLDSTIKPTNQRARTADGKMMNIIGETDVTLYRDSKPYHLVSLVCSDPTDLLLGIPFMRENDVAVRPATDEIILGGKEFIKYDPVRKLSHNKANRVAQFMIQSTERQVILPGETGVFTVSGVADTEDTFVVEPKWSTHCNQKATKDSEVWPSPQIVSVNKGTIILPNHSKEPIIIKKKERKQAFYYKFYT